MTGLDEETHQTTCAVNSPCPATMMVKDREAQDYVMPLIGKQGNYHSREIWLYREQLRENMALRALQWLKK